MSDEQSNSSPWIQPRDILTPAATLVGLVIAAIGLSSTVATVSTLLQTLSVALVLVIVLFVSAAFVTCLSFLRNSRGMFRAAVVLYSIGWIFVGIVVTLLLVGNAWGVQILQIPIPQFPHIDIETLLSAGVSLFSIIVTLVIYRRTRIDKRQLIRLTDQLAEDRNKIGMITQRALETDSNDPKMALVKVAIELESVLRRTAISHGLSDREGRVAGMLKVRDYLLSKKLIDQATANSITYVWAIRNKIVHSGGDVSEKDAGVALDLAATILANLQH